MNKTKASKMELFAEDENASSWGAHQLYRIQRLMEKRTYLTGIPMTSLRLAFTAKHSIKLINRAGVECSYKPSGVIDHIEIPDVETESLMFDVRWVDPLGYGYTDTMSFLEIRFDVMDEFTFALRERQVKDAYLKNRVVTQ